MKNYYFASVSNHVNHLICLILVLTFFSCSDDSSTNNNPGPVPCVKSCNLFSPADDSLIHFQTYGIDTISFLWFNASCEPFSYKFIISEDSNFLNIVTSFSTTDTIIKYRPQTWGQHNEYWHVIVYYSNDSIITPFRKLQIRF
jgi:hypothetical protein